MVVKCGDNADFDYDDDVDGDYTVVRNALI